MRLCARLAQLFRPSRPASLRHPLWPNDSMLSFGCVDAMSETKSRSSSQETHRTHKSYPDHPGVRSGSRCESRRAGSPLMPLLTRFPSPTPPLVRQSFYGALSDMQGNLGFAPALELKVY